MTEIAHRNQVCFVVVAGLASEFLVMDLKVLQAAAVLTSPGVTLEDL
jgi:hypothetical protein